MLIKLHGALTSSALPTFLTPVVRLQVHQQLGGAVGVSREVGEGQVDTTLTIARALVVHVRYDVIATANVTVVFLHAPTEVHASILR